MDMTGEQRIQAPRETVWQALNDPDILQACIPGCQELIKSSETEMTAVALVKVGPVTARFSGAVTLSELDPPNGYRISGEGQGGVAGFAKGGALVRLEEDGDDTFLYYEVSAQVGGKLSQLGRRLIDATAKQMSSAFFKRFAAEIAQGGAAPPVARITSSLTAGVAGAGLLAGGSPSAPPPGTGADTAAPRRPSSPPVDVTPPVLRHAGTIGIAVVALALIAAWFVLGVPGPATTATTAAVSPDLAYAVQLVLVAAVAYLFGRQRAT